MTKCLMLCLLAGAAVFFDIAAAGAVVTSTTNVACSSTVKLQKAIDAAAAGSIATFVVSGTCTENILVPHGKTVVIKGASLVARLVAQNATLPALVSNGVTTLQGMTVSNPAGAAEALIQANQSGHINILGSDLSAPKVNTVLEIWNTASGNLVNSRVIGGQGVGMEVADSASLYVNASPAEVAGPEGAKVTISSPTGAAIACDGGASLAVRARSAGGANGSVVIRNSKMGLNLSQCDATIVNRTPVASNLLITGMAANGPALGIDNGTTFIRNITISGNAGQGLALQAGSATVTASTIRSNAQGDILLDYGAVAMMRGFNGPSNMPDAFSASKIGCFTSSYIAAPRLVIDDGGLTVPAGKKMADLMSFNGSCVSPPLGAR